MHADADGKVRGQYPAENGKVAPFESLQSESSRQTRERERESTCVSERRVGVDVYVERLKW